MALVRRMAIALTLLISTSLVFYGNFFIYPRDQFVTVNISSFQPSEIISKRLWTEGPVQVLNTFMSDETFFIGVGYPDSGGIGFADRLAISFGEDHLDRSRNPIDLRNLLSDEELRTLLDFVQSYSYRSIQACPHDSSSQCTFAVGWNRDRTREKNMRMFISRVTDETYLIVDDSILGLEP